MTDILKYKKQLEFDKVCELASEYAVCEDARNAVLSCVPLTELDEACDLLELTDALVKLVVRNRPPTLTAVRDITEISVRAKKGGVLSMGELISVGRMLKNARVFMSWVPDDDDMAPVAALTYMLYQNVSFERRVGDAILSETEMADTASANLAAVRKKIMRAELSIKDKLESLVRGQNTSKLLQDAIVTMRAGRYVVPVKSEHRNEIKGLVHDVSSSGGTYFVEPAAVVEANNLIVTLRAEEAAEIERILLSFSSEVSDFADELKTSFAAFIQLDAALAKARYALSYDGIKPEFSDKISLRKARHPLISKDRVVPVDIEVGGEYDSLIITGPNTGGKTVTLKTTGLLCLMAMSGMLIPAKQGSTLRCFTQILVDIGDEQSIVQNLSTFSGHIKNIIEILKTADESSLVLIDELGAGTDPAEGAALAIAILKRLRSLGSTVMATTHYGEIKVYAVETKGVQNASCEFDEKTLSPTYRITIGIPGRSNALLIGEKLGLDSGIIQDAKRNMSSESRRFEDVLSEIEQLKNEAARRVDEAQELAETAQKELAEAQAQRDSIKRQGELELENAKKKAKQLIADVSARAYALTDELRKLEADKKKDRDKTLARARAIARTDSANLYDMTDPVYTEESAAEPLDDPHIGDTALLKDLNQVVELISMPDKNGMLEVRAGSIRTRVHIDRLGKLNAPPKPKKHKAEYVPSAVPQSRSTHTEINLIGLTTDEARLEVERFIDDGVTSKLNTLYIIHGKGTGALRSAVHGQLKKMKQVKSFRLGQYGEGEDGVTVVELK